MFPFFLDTFENDYPLADEAFQELSWLGYLACGSTLECVWPPVADHYFTTGPITNAYSALAE